MLQNLVVNDEKKEAFAKPTGEAASKYPHFSSRQINTGKQSYQDKASTIQSAKGLKQKHTGRPDRVSPKLKQLWVPKKKSSAREDMDIPLQTSGTKFNSPINICPGASSKSQNSNNNKLPAVSIGPQTHKTVTSSDSDSTHRLKESCKTTKNKKTGHPNWDKG